MAIIYVTISARLVSSAKEEREVNEFAHYLLKPLFSTKLSIMLYKYKKLLIISISVLIVVTVVFSIWKYTVNEKSYPVEYYKITNGEKYHERDCMYYN